MAEHQGWMILYTENWTKHQLKFLAPMGDFDKLWERARRGVDDAPSVPGTQEKRHESAHGNVHKMWSWASGGLREASLETLPILRE